MAKQNGSNEFTIYPWMVSELQLSGNELLVYALIHNECMEKGKSTLSLVGMQMRLNIVHTTICRIAKGLEQKGLIINNVVGVRNNRYYTIKPTGHERQ